LSSPNVSKPPQPTKPPLSLSSSYRTIYITKEEQPTPEVITPKDIEEGWGTRFDAEDLYRMAIGVQVNKPPPGYKFGSTKPTAEGYEITYIPLTPKEVVEGWGKQYGAEDLRAVAAATKIEVPEGYKFEKATATQEGWQVSYAPLTPSTQTDIDTDIEKALPQGANILGVERTPQGFNIEYTMPMKQPSITESFLEGRTLEEMPEYLLSELAFRSVWDVGWRAKTEAKSQEWLTKYTPQERAYASQIRTELSTTAVSLAIIGFAAYDIGRSLYHIAKWGGIKGPIETSLTPELEEKQFAYTMISGQKGARVPSVVTYQPQEPKPEEWTVTLAPKGTYRYARLDKLVKSEEASTTLPQLLYYPSQLQTMKVPLGLYEPKFLTETMFAGISAGALINSMLKSSLVAMPTRATKASQILGAEPSQLSIQGLSSMTELASIQAQSVKQAQKQAMSQTQLSKQLQIQKSIKPQDLLETFKKHRKGKEEPFGLFGRYKREYPILTAKQVLKLKKGKYLI
jgi:hypothetical protein